MHRVAVRGASPAMFVRYGCPTHPPQTAAVVRAGVPPREEAALRQGRLVITYKREEGRPQFWAQWTLLRQKGM